MEKNEDESQPGSSAPQSLKNFTGGVNLGGAGKINWEKVVGVERQTVGWSWNLKGVFTEMTDKYCTC